jgi:large subunit ribosomal protein L15
MPIYRRLPRRGFHNHFSLRYAIVNLSTIEQLGVDVVDLGVLMEAGLVKKAYDGLKVLGDGELTRPVTIKAKKFSQSAMEKIASASGTAEVV